MEGEGEGEEDGEGEGAVDMEGAAMADCEFCYREGCEKKGGFNGGKMEEKGGLFGSFDSLLGPPCDLSTRTLGE